MDTSATVQPTVTCKKCAAAPQEQQAGRRRLQWRFRQAACKPPTGLAATGMIACSCRPACRTLACACSGQAAFIRGNTSSACMHQCRQQQGRLWAVLWDAASMAGYCACRGAQRVLPLGFCLLALARLLRVSLHCTSVLCVRQVRAGKAKLSKPNLAMHATIAMCRDRSARTTSISWSSLSRRIRRHAISASCDRMSAQGHTPCQHAACRRSSAKAEHLQHFTEHITVASIAAKRAPRHQPSRAPSRRSAGHSARLS